MTNNPTIDGVSPELRELLERVVGKPTGKPNWDALDETRIAASDELRALLDAPAVERQPAAFLYETAMKCTENSEGRVYSGFLPSLGVSLPSVPEDSLRNIRPLYEAAPEVAALQSTIARLEARVAELESGMGEPIYEIEYLGEGGGGWVETDKHQFDVTSKLKNFRTRIVFTAPPAPVAVVPDERAAFESNYKPEALERDGDEYVRMPIQMAWEGWQARACLDATAALNGPAE